MASDNCDPVWRSVYGPRGRGITRHQDQKDFRAVTNTQSKTSKEESDAHTSAGEFAETKESFTDSVADRDAEEQIETQKRLSYSDTGRITVSNRNPVCESDGITRSWSRKERLAKCESFA